MPVRSGNEEKLYRIGTWNIRSLRNKECEIHKFTWKCPGRGLKLIIDYFLVRNEMKRNMNNVKVVRGAEIGSDHHLVLMKVRLHRRVLTRKVEERSRLNTERLATKEGKWRIKPD